MAYVYRHIRLDKNTPFYIGIGGDDEYARAYTKLGRNKYWQNIVGKTNYEVEIIYDDIDWVIACQKEIEFISIYKRRKDGGTLANLTLGGEGQLGMIPWNFGKETPSETKEKQRQRKLGKSATWMIGTKISEEQRGKMVKALREKGAWNKGIPQTASAKEKYLKSMEGRILKGDKHPMYGKKMPDHVREKLRIANESRIPWNKGKKCNYRVPHESFKKTVIKYDLEMNFIEEFDSCGAAAKSINTKKGEISNCCSGRIRFHKGFIWRYKNEKPRFQGRN